MVGLTIFLRNENSEVQASEFLLVSTKLLLVYIFELCPAEDDLQLFNIVILQDAKTNEKPSDIGIFLVRYVPLDFFDGFPTFSV